MAQPQVENNKLNITVLAGGIGPEREISLQSGRRVTEALKQAGLNVVTSDITPDDLTILDDTTIDVFFLALHGTFGEDGQLQQILEDKSLAYTGSDPTACKLAMDKMASKKAFNIAGVNTPAAIEFTPDTDIEQVSRLADKFVIKPINQGSSVGINIAEAPSIVVEHARQCFEKFGDCMIEQFIPGREITVGILAGQPLPIIEIKSRTGIYDYNAKYIDESTQYLFDTIEPTLAKKIQQDAITCFNTLGLRHFARVDFIFGDDQTPYVLEANTIPGMTTHSLVPMAAEKIGLSMGDLCIKIIEAALQNKKLNIIH